MQNKENISVSAEISKSVAVASWSGFIYQGKVALYRAIQLLIDDKLSYSYSLKVEHLDDFVIFNDKTALSIHQVKSTKSKYRSSYKKALDQAAEVVSDHFNIDTLRFFHVSVDIDDFTNHSHNGQTVSLFKYHDGKLFVTPDEIDGVLKGIISNYLDKNSLINSLELVSHKFDKLNSLLAQRVNFAHALNQNQKYTQYESTDSSPILFSEIIDCLASVVLDFQDKKHLLFRFKSQFIQIIDEFAGVYEEENSDELEDELVHLSTCKKIMSNLDSRLLERLYISLDPTNFSIESDIGKVVLERYLNIINELPSFISNNNLPHYLNTKYDKYIPSCIELNGMSKKVQVNKLDKHLSDLRSNTTLLNILFEFDNLIVAINESSFKVSEFSKPKATHNGDCIDDVNNSEFITLKITLLKLKILDLFQ
ncbi:ABC-three component system protein [Paraglaciecola arctica]|uniref:CD-NTase associated protein 4-like DNA endonuclease domain-containing protein n=1 Tax=Paraglaciecola arctica BSs20135 TaxID=493475 RepID=K6Y677_9ALTE|nr:ABC-three component system protein [Paraglaciecola arctica]GAC19456.1 hypothetical protein GARC_2490 [Paraglaciecola arctica BSs20135]